MKFSLIGYGKMGHMIEEIALQRGHTIACIIDINNPEDIHSEAFRSSDVAIEFTTPQAAFTNICTAFSEGVKVVSGSTGWRKDHFADILRLIDEGNTLFWASNFSLGVAIFSAVNKKLAQIMNAFPSYDVRMEEVHHIHKLDAPSGTAITLAEDIISEIDRKSSWELCHFHKADGTVEQNNDITPQVLPIDAFRREEVPGIHSVIYESEADEITLTHSAHSRRGFALGAVLAAEFTATHQGLLTTSDLFSF
ncbi:MAG: 4-hydroxy-tetrahydrodipicolinate reductase [Alloprevotella sp.]|nr:4-hydroxy-tetrahydrodipicolinate reductase [Alloprevotella sp.]